MFVFSKGKPKSFNRIEDRENVSAGRKVTGKSRKPDGSLVDRNYNRVYKDKGSRWNLWTYANGGQNAVGGHPATFPIDLARDHIISWSNPGELVLDPFLGSGTAGVACKELGRNFIGIEFVQSYFDIAKKRIEEASR
jgi:DNA modification methylase